MYRYFSLCMVLFFSSPTQANENVEYLPAVWKMLSPAKAARAIDISGDWKGVVRCSNKTFPVSLKLTSTVFEIEPNQHRYHGRFKIGWVLETDKPESPFRNSFFSNPITLEYWLGIRRFHAKVDPAPRAGRRDELQFNGLIVDTPEPRLLARINPDCELAVLSQTVGEDSAETDLKDMQESTLAAWYEWMHNELERDAPIEEHRDIRMVPQWLRLSRDNRMTKLIVLSRQAQAIDTERNEAWRFALDIEEKKDSLAWLFNRIRYSRTQSGATRRALALGLDYYLEDAAMAFLLRPQGWGTAEFMSTFIEQYGNAETCPARTPEVCLNVADLLQQDLNTLMLKLVQNEQQSFDELKNAAFELDTLSNLVEFENDLQQRYGTAIDHQAFQRFNESRHTHRRSIQEKLDETLVSKLSPLNTTTEIAAFKARYFAPGDLRQVAMRDLVAQMDEKLSFSRPFSGMAGADYFNAIYNQEQDTIREHDSVYMSGLNDANRFAADLMRFAGSGVPGTPLGSLGAALEAETESSSAVDSVLATYLLEYQDIYGKCLRSDAITITVSTDYQEATRNSYGFTIAPVRQWTTKSSYRINREFADHYEYLFSEEGDSALSLMDFMANSGRITTLRNGLRQLMRKHECDSPEIAQFESSLRALATR